MSLPSRLSLLSMGMVLITAFGCRRPPSTDEALRMLAAHDPALRLARGIVIDRRQYSSIPPPAEMRISDNDIAVIKNLGFDHVKVLFTPSFFMTETGDLNDANMWYIDDVVNRIVAKDLSALVCIHPEDDFKRKYLGSADQFPTLLRWYEKLGTYLADRWKPQQVALQLMTEPYGNYASWNIMHPKMHLAARRGMPLHTLVLSADDASKLEALLRMEPVDDPNVYYGLTTYEPYEVGFNGWLPTFLGHSPWWAYVQNLPYPASTEAVTASMPQLIAAVPAEMQAKARSAVDAYGAQGYGRDWLEARVRRVEEWARKGGRHLAVLVNEFGCMDQKLARTKGGGYIATDTRIRFVRDLREIFEAHGLAWSYWSYNEIFTIFDPERRVPFGPTTTELADNAMIEALGLR